MNQAVASGMGGDYYLDPSYCGRGRHPGWLARATSSANLLRTGPRADARDDSRHGLYRDCFDDLFFCRGRPAVLHELLIFCFVTVTTPVTLMIFSFVRLCSVTPENKKSASQ